MKKISYSDMEIFQKIAKELGDVCGIINQIDHLHRPDDQEDLDTAYEYLMIEINKQIDGWTKLKNVIRTLVQI